MQIYLCTNSEDIIVSEKSPGAIFVKYVRILQHIEYQKNQNFSVLRHRQAKMYSLWRFYSLNINYLERLFSLYFRYKNLPSLAVLYNNKNWSK